jgi:hypothetical protein
MGYATQAAVDINGAGDHVVIAGVAGKQTRILGFDLTLAAASTVQLKHGATALTGVMQLDSYAKGRTEDDIPWFTCAAGEDFVITLGAAVQCGGSIWYRQD